MASSSGAIYKNMNNGKNPLYPVTMSEWKCPQPSELNTFDDFCQRFDIKSEKDVSYGGQASIYSYTRKNSHSKERIIAKVYDLSIYMSSLNQVWVEYTFIKKTNLLQYDGIYYIKGDNQAVITSKPLTYTFWNGQITKIYNLPFIRFFFEHNIIRF